MKPILSLIVVVLLGVSACKSQLYPADLKSDGGVPACGTTNACPATSFCEAKAGTCPAKPSSADTCIEKPTDCKDIPSNSIHPVCGCDGKTYASNCERQKAGVSLDHNGKCVSTCPKDPFAAIGKPCAEEGQSCGGENCTDPCQFCNLITCINGIWQQLEAFPDPSCSPDLALDACSAAGGYCALGDEFEPTCKVGFHKDDKISATGACGLGICCLANNH